MTYRFSQDAQVYPITYLNGVLDATGNVNVRNNNVSTAWVDVAGFYRFFAFVKCDRATWNGADGLTTLKLQQATSSAGAGAKDLTTSGAGNNYNTTNDTLTASSSQAIVEATANDLDASGGFHFIRLYAASTGNTAADNLFGFLVVLDAYDKKKQQQGAYSAAVTVYVNPQGASS